MANDFMDTSALVKYYHAEDGTQEVTQLLEEPAARHYISRLSLVETVSAFAVKCRMRHIDEREFDALRRRFYHDIGQGRFRMLPVTAARYEEATELIAGRLTACRGFGPCPSRDDRPLCVCGPTAL
jgi:predicted nucleic acid-binding protein